MIRLFISSTFSDMGRERDVIHKEIYPRLREYGLAKGVPVDICDLRWGIDSGDDDENALKQIMDVCFREVENCEPYIVSIIGQRYGTVAKPETQEKIAAIWRSLGRESDLPEDREISLTQWELEYSFLSNHDKKVRALCMFKRDVPGAEHGVSALKNRILAKKDDSETSECIHVREYSSADEDFGTIFIEEIEAFIDEKAEEAMIQNPAQREFAAAEAYSELKASLFHGREDAVGKYDRFIADPEKNILLFHGSSGIGKSTLLAKLFRNAAEGGRKCRLIACGASEHSCDYLNLVKQIIFTLEEHLYKEKAEYRSRVFNIEHAEAVLTDVIKKVNDSKNAEELILFIDAMDKVENRGGIRLLTLLSNHLRAGTIKIIGSQIDAGGEQLRDNIEEVKLEPLTDNEVRFMLRRKLFSSFQEIDAQSNSIINAIMNKDAAAEPLYLDIVVSCLRMHMADAESLEKRNAEFVSMVSMMPENTEEMIQYALYEAIKYLEIDQRRMVKGIGLIALSKYGLREQNLQSVMGEEGWIPLEFSRLRTFLNMYFRQQSSGAWVFEHDIIRASLQGLLINEQIIDDLRKQLYHYLLNRSCNDTEMIARESSWLNCFYHDYEYAGVLLWKLTELSGEDRFAVRTIAANELDEMSSSDASWFSELCRRYETAVMKLLRDLLELHGSEDYARQYPAMKLTDLYLREKELSGDLNNEEITSRLRQWTEGQLFTDQFAIVSFITEYCNILESCGRHLDAAGFVAFAIDFYLKSRNIERMSEWQRAQAFHYINSLFFTSNKIINAQSSPSDGLIALSEAVIRSYEKDALNVRSSQTEGIAGRRTRELEALYTSNTGQYYNARKEYEKALEYHFESLLKKVNNFFDAYGDETLRAAFFDAIRKSGIGGSEVSDIKCLLKLDLDQQLAFWERVEESFSHAKEHTVGSIKENWKVIGVNYRNLGWDLFHYSPTEDGNEKGHYDEWIDFACKSMEISVRMLSSPVVGITAREQIVSNIRSIALQNKKQDDALTEEFFKRITEQIEETVKQYLDYATYIGEKERRNLKGNIDKSRELAVLKSYDDIAARLNAQSNLLKTAATT